MAIARISGPLLAANLKRTLSNLAFETDLLYIGALNGRVGVKTDSPNAELNVNGQVNTPNVYATRLTGGNLEFSTTGVRSITGDIILNAVENIKIDGPICDIGCGTGLVASEIKKKVPNAIIDGVDISKDMIQISREKNIYRNFQSVSSLTPPKSRK